MKSNSSKYSEATRRFLLVERDNSFIPIYQIYQNTNIPIQIKLKLVARKRAHKTNICRVQIYTQHILSSFPSPSFVIHATKKYTLNKINWTRCFILCSLLCFPFCVPYAADLYIYQPSIVYIQSYVLDILVFDVLLSIAFGNLPITYCCV